MGPYPLTVDLFQLLPVPEGFADAQVVEQGLWEIDEAERTGFGTIWFAEHHLSSFGLIGVPSVLAAAAAQRTRRIGIGYAVAVVPLHHPVRLAEEISWVDALSNGRVRVGLGPGFSPFEYAAYGIPAAERAERFAEGTTIVRGLLTAETFRHDGRFWSFPDVTLRPRPRADLTHRLYRASGSDESLLEAAQSGTPVLLGLKSRGEIARTLDLYRDRRLELGLRAPAIENEIAQFGVLRRVCVAASDAEAWSEAREAVAWEEKIARQVHEGRPAAPGDAPVTTDLEIPGACIGSPASVRAELRALATLGIRRVLCWIRFGNVTFESVQRSMRLLTDEVLADAETKEAVSLTT
jgi:alkanesulfonate monooxygenase SsuD/methylene tetrahydromethanopterin reductase-like flavin-dependent oxidoreductase (luciferase family)